MPEALISFSWATLGAEITIVAPVNADDGERDVVLHAGSGLGREKIAPGSLEKFQHGLVFERRRIGEVNHHLRAGQGVLESLACKGVDPALRRGGEDLVATPA